VAPGEYEAEAVIGKDLNGEKKIVPATVRAAERTEVEAK
jgi:hypothetical protein